MLLLTLLVLIVIGNEVVGFLGRDQACALLYLHNSLRRKVSNGLLDSLPEGSDMLEMYWNEQLALDAQRWLDVNCVDVSCKNQTAPEMNGRGVNFGQLGFNTMLRAFEEIFNNWESSRNFKSTTVKPQHTKSSGENSTVDIGSTWNSTTLEILKRNIPNDSFSSNESSTQSIGPQLKLYTTQKPLSQNGDMENFKIMVNAKTDRMGCGATKLNSTYYVLLCLYSPPVTSEPLYQDGKPCSKCPAESKCDEAKFSGLCVVPKGNYQFCGEMSRVIRTQGRNSATFQLSSEICCLLSVSALFTMKFFRMQLTNY